MSSIRGDHGRQMGKRVKRRVGEHKGRSTIAEQWISYTRDMVERAQRFAC
jgi:hypothetical protein